MSCGELGDCCEPCRQKWFKSNLRADQGGDTDVETDPHSLSPVEIKGWMLWQKLAGTAAKVIDAIIVSQK